MDRHRFDADSDPTFHLDTDPDPAFHFDADPDPVFHFYADPDSDRILPQVLNILENLTFFVLLFTAVPKFFVLLFTAVPVNIVQRHRWHNFQYLEHFIEIFWKKFSLSLLVHLVAMDTVPAK